MFQNEFKSCIEACVRCAQACEQCATACLSEANVRKMAECIRLDRDCAESCWIAAAFMSRRSMFANDLCRLCAEICDASGAECEKHRMDHCQECAAECKNCAEIWCRVAGVAV